MNEDNNTADCTVATKRRIGIVGYGSLGKYLVQQILPRNDLELAFVWNRTASKVIDELGNQLALHDLQDVKQRSVDLIVEVADPSITHEFGELFLTVADYMIGSPTAFADCNTERLLRQKAESGSRGLYVPSGAFWGGSDIQKMADMGTLKGLTVTMAKHPNSLKVLGELKEVNDKVKDAAVTLYEGPVRQLCSLAPNNINTMAAASIAGWNLGFDGVTGRLISDPNLVSWHRVEVDVVGPGEGDDKFTVKTVRMNPAGIGKVTGNATYASFFSSLLGAHGRGNGIHLC